MKVGFKPNLYSFIKKKKWILVVNQIYYLSIWGRILCSIVNLYFSGTTWTCSGRRRVTATCWSCSGTTCSTRWIRTVRPGLIWPTSFSASIRSALFKLEENVHCHVTKRGGGSSDEILFFITFYFGFCIHLRKIPCQFCYHCHLYLHNKVWEIWFCIISRKDQ